MAKPICHGVIAMVALAAFVAAAMVQPGRAQLSPQSHPLQSSKGHGSIPQTSVSSDRKFPINLSSKKAKAKGKGYRNGFRKGFDIGWQIAQCLGNYDNLKVCVAEIREAFTIGDLTGINDNCCEAFTGIADDCLGQSFARFVPQLRVPMTTVTTYCYFVKTIRGFILI